MSFKPSKRKFEIKDNKVVFTPDKNIPRITGTYISSLVGKNPFATPFIASLRMCAILREDISSKPAIKAGVALEPVLIEYANSILNTQIIPAEEINQEKKGDHDTWKSDFDHPIFGGHIDGFSSDGSIVEVKTTSDARGWAGNQIPEHYWLQASLYAVLSGVDKIIFIVGILDQEHLSNPYLFKPDITTNTIITEVGLHPEIYEVMATTEQYYKDYLAKGIIPIPDNLTKAEQEALNTIKAQVEDIGELIAQIEDLTLQLENMKEIEKELTSLKERVKLNLEFTGTERITSNDYVYSIQESSRTAVDTDKLKASGLYAEYSKTTTTKQLKITKLKGSEY